MTEVVQEGWILGQPSAKVSEIQMKVRLLQPLCVQLRGTDNKSTCGKRNRLEATLQRTRLGIMCFKKLPVE